MNQLATQSLLAFTQWTNPDYRAGRPHLILAQYLDLLVAGSIKRLMVFMPPRHGKSELVSRRLPAYFLGRFPDQHVIACSYSAGLASRLNRDCQRIMDSPAYAQVFPGVSLRCKPHAEREVYCRPHAPREEREVRPVRTDHLFEIAGHAGSYRSAGVGGGITGMGFDLGIIDDPVKNHEQAHSAVIRDKIDEWYSSTFWTRQAPDARILLTMTRWHHDDIAARLLRRIADSPDADQWTILCLPAIADYSSAACGPGAQGPQAAEEILDDRVPGEALWPERFPLRFLNSARASLGAYLFAGMYQQQPTTAGGNHFKEDWFGHRFQDAGNYWRLGDRRHLKAGCTVFATCDPAESERETGDHTAIGVWAVTPGNDLLALNMVRGRFGVEGIVPELARVCARWQPEWLAVEATGFQVSLVHQARRTAGLPPVREISHEGKGKLVRATPAIVLAESGKLWLPTEAPWVGAYIDELVKFTGLTDQEDDQVDATAYAVWQMQRMHVEDEPNERTRERIEAEHSHAEALGLWGRGR